VTEWRFIAIDIIYAIHDQQIARHGGSGGVRDAGLIESALARPRNRVAYGEPDAAEFTATYAHGLAMAHGFIDGNKRVAWVAARLFLADNGYVFAAEAVDAIRTMEGVAAGTIGEEELAAWFRARARPA
jgi:death-on-curing protein